MDLSRRQLRLLKSLSTRKGRDESGLFLLEGVRLCEELAASGLPVELAVFAEGETGERTRRLRERFVAAGVPLAEARLSDLERVSDTVHSQGVLAAARWQDRRVEELAFGPRATVLALDAVADPGNVGAIVRTAAWFGAAAVLLGRGCADLLNPKTVRATMGGIFHVPVCRDVDLPAATQSLKAQGFRATAAALDGSPEWAAWAETPRSLLLLGSEAHGVSEEVARLADRRVTIPRRGRGESLNVAITAGILLAVAARAAP